MAQVVLRWRHEVINFEGQERQGHMKTKEDFEACWKHVPRTLWVEQYL